MRAGPCPGPCTLVTVPMPGTYVECTGAVGAAARATAERECALSEPAPMLLRRWQLLSDDSPAAGNLSLESSRLRGGGGAAAAANTLLNSSVSRASSSRFELRLPV